MMLPAIASILSKDFITFPMSPSAESRFTVMMPIRSISTSATLLMTAIVLAAPLVVNLVLRV